LEEKNMLKKVTSLLICAVMLVVSAPAKALAQTKAQPAPASSRQGASDAQAKPKRDLKTAIAEVTAKSRFDTVTQADLKRLERERLSPQNTSKGGFTRKEKILVYSIVAGLVVLAVVLGVKTGKGGHAFCDTDPTDPDCIGPFP
jgi:hypothetical protein